MVALALSSPGEPTMMQAAHWGTRFALVSSAPRRVVQADHRTTRDARRAIFRSQPSGYSPHMRAIDATRLYFDRAADQMDLSENMRQLLLTAKREISVQIAVELDNGEIATMIGYRVQHDDARGPMKGGLRYHPEVDIGEVPLAGSPDDLEDRAGRPALRRSQRRAWPLIPRSTIRASWNASRASSSTASTTSSVPTSTFRHPTWAPTPRSWPGS